MCQTDELVELELFVAVAEEYAVVVDLKILCVNGANKLQAESTKIVFGEGAL